jgi:hypothetical protein
VEPGPQPGGTQRDVDGGLGLPAHALDVVVAEPERAHGRARADRVEQLVGHDPGDDALPCVQRRGGPGVPADGVRLDRHGQQRGEQEPPVQHGDPAEGERDRQRGAGQRG